VIGTRHFFVLKASALPAFMALCVGGCVEAPRTTRRMEVVPAPSGLHTRYAGVTTLLISDGSSSVLIDGFFSRLAKTNLLPTIKPDEKAIRAGLEQMGLGKADEPGKLDGIIVAHSHYDHGFDAGRVAVLTQSNFYGSQSAAYIACGAEVPEDRIYVFKHRRPENIGNFRVTAFETPHAPSPAPFPGAIETPIRPPVPLRRYRVGVNYTFLIEHKTEMARILVVPSGNYVSGVLKKCRADTVFLAIALLGRQPREYTERLWEETVLSVKAKRVVLVHWDDFSLSLDQPMQFLPGPIDNIPKTMERILGLAARDGVVVECHPLFVPVRL
jgi:L-ascorbate metabolism protein UlaG (beta-lactamase superfamily)